MTGLPEDRTPAAAVRASWRTFLHDLFDLRFRNLIAMRMLPGVYGIGIAAAALFTLYVTARAFKDSIWDGLVWVLVLGPAMFITLVTALRMLLEFVLAFFRMAWYIEHLAGQTEGLRKDMPKFGWWRSLLFGEGSADSSAPRKPPDPG